MRVSCLLGLSRQDDGQTPHGPIQMLLAAQKISRVEETLKTNGSSSSGESQEAKTAPTLARMDQIKRDLA